VTGWFWHAVVAAVLHGAHQIFTRLTAKRIGGGLDGFVVEASAALSILLYLYFFGSADTEIKNSARLDLIIQFSPEICVGTGTIAFFLLSKRPATFGGSRNFGRRRRSRGNCRHFIFSRSAVVAAGAWHHFLDRRFIFTAEVTSRSRARQGTAGAMIRKTGEPFMFFKGK